MTPRKLHFLSASIPGGCHWYAVGSSANGGGLAPGPTAAKGRSP